MSLIKIFFHHLLALDSLFLSLRFSSPPSPVTRDAASRLTRMETRNEIDRVQFHSFLDTVGNLLNLAVESKFDSIAAINDHIFTSYRMKWFSTLELSVKRHILLQICCKPCSLRLLISTIIIRLVGVPNRKTISNLLKQRGGGEVATFYGHPLWCLRL